MTDDNVVRPDFTRGRKPATEEHKPTIMDAIKASAFSDLVADGVCMCVIDGRAPGVVVPFEALDDDGIVGLNFSRKFAPGDLSWNSQAVTATLSFHGVAYPCTVPWRAIVAMRLGDEVVRFGVVVPA